MVSVVESHQSVSVLPGEVLDRPKIRPATPIDWRCGEEVGEALSDEALDRPTMAGWDWWTCASPPDAPAHATALSDDALDRPIDVCAGSVGTRPPLSFV